jgi:putative DNA primase/helicase
MPREITGPGGGAFPVYEPRAPYVNGSDKASGDSRSSVEILPASAFKVEPVRWLWPQWLASGKLHLLAGSPGTGKTTIGLSFAAIVSTKGGTWPDGSKVDYGDVLIWSGEDDIGDTLLPRLLAAGGAPEQVHFVTGAAENGKSRPFDPSVDMAKLGQAASLLPNLKLLILDPVVSAVSGDSHKNTETRRGLQPVVDLAAQLDCVVLGITHLSKNSSGREPLDRVTGSVAFGAVARVVLATVKPADHEAPRRLVRAKSNLGPDTGGFEYRLYSAPVPGYDFNNQRVEWGEVLDGSARELMAVEQPDEDGHAVNDAESFLADMLRDGPVPTKELQAAAKAHGYAWRTVERAKGALGVTATKAAFHGTWAWKLPDVNTVTSDDEDRQHA